MAIFKSAVELRRRGAELFFPGPVNYMDNGFVSLPVIQKGHLSFLGAHPPKVLVLPTAPAPTVTFQTEEKC